MSAGAYEERGVVFPCEGNRLVGVAALPEKAAQTGVLLVVGGPQYRVGSHRQFTLLARSLAEAGIASLRFDYTGMGDSEGPRREFSETPADIEAALAAFSEAAPGVTRVVLWGLCDAASAAMMYAHRFPTVTGVVLLNPWVHGDEYSPRVKLSYYGPALAARENWGRLLSGKIRLVPAVGEVLASSARTAAGWVGLSRGDNRHSFVAQMLEGFRRFDRDVLVILSEDDFTAREFTALLENDREWRGALERDSVTSHTVAGADHTFSSRQWRDEVAALTVEWVARR